MHKKISYVNILNSMHFALGIETEWYKRYVEGKESAFGGHVAN